MPALYSANISFNCLLFNSASSFSNLVYATFPTNVLGNESLNSYSTGSEYFAKFIYKTKILSIIFIKGLVRKNQGGFSE